MENDEVLRKSIKATNEERDALRQVTINFQPIILSNCRAACEITKEVVEELEKRVHIM